MKCHCGLEIRQRQSGQCWFIFPDGRRCRSKRGLLARNVSDHLPNVWYAGYEHIDPDPEAPCACGRTKAECLDSGLVWSGHRYRPRSVSRNHRAEEEHMASHCRPTLAALTEVMANCPPPQILSMYPLDPEVIIDQIEDAELRDVAWAELKQLPDSFWWIVLHLWNTAVDAGVPFSIESEEAPKPIEYAKAGRVVYRIEHDNEGVRMYVSHVHGHHAEAFTR